MTATVLIFPTVKDYLDHVDPDSVTSADLMTRSGITPRNLEYWCRLGILRDCPRPPGTGIGYPRRFPTSELAVACLMRQLLDGGLSLRPAHEHARTLLETGTTRIAGITIHLPEEI